MNTSFVKTKSDFSSTKDLDRALSVAAARMWINVNGGQGTISVLHLRAFPAHMSFRYFTRSALMAILALPLSAFAQESRNGPKLGLGIGTQVIGSFFGWSGQPKIGPVVGWSFEAPVTEQVSLLIEPMYIGKGSVSVNPPLKLRSSIALNYLEIPLMVKVSTNPDPQGLFLTGGLMYGYFLHGRIKNFRNGALESQYDFAPAGTTRRSQFSAGIGLGHEMGHWMYELRAQSSLSMFDLQLRSRNLVYSFQVAWRFATQAEKEEKRLKRELEEY